MKDKNLLFSILVPVYNVEKYIRECLNSLVDQGIDNYEIVLTDDGSTDSSGEICEEYKEKYPDLIRVFHKENEGLLLTRRSGIRNARGEYLVFVDSDDFIETNTIRKFSDIAKQFDPDMIVYYGDRYDGRNYLKFRETLYKDSRLICEDEKEEYYRATITHRISNGMCGKVVRRSIVDIENEYEDYKYVSVGEDLLQSLPLITTAKRIYFLNDILYHYRINPNSVGRVFDYKRYDSMRSVEVELSRYAQNWKVEDKENLIARHALVETVWGCLRVLSKSGVDYCSEESKSLFDRMSDDSFMCNYYNSIDRKKLNIAQRIVLNNLYNKNYKTMIILLRMINFIKH